LKHVERVYKLYKKILLPWLCIGGCVCENFFCLLGLAPRDEVDDVDDVGRVEHGRVVRDLLQHLGRGVAVDDDAVQNGSKSGSPVADV
jgi:hypothetical protein